MKNLFISVILISDTFEEAQKKYVKLLKINKHMLIRQIAKPMLKSNQLIAQNTFKLKQKRMK